MIQWELLSLESLFQEIVGAILETGHEAVTLNDSILVYNSEISCYLFIH